MATQTPSRPPRTNYHIAEIERLVVPGANGDIPAIDLTSFFQLILQTVYERGSITVSTIRTLAHIGGLDNDFKRLARQYSKSYDEGLQTGLTVLLQQLAHRGFLREDNGTWYKTDNLVLDTDLYIVKYSKQWGIVHLSSGMSVEEAKRLEDKRREQEAETRATILATKLSPDREGWRLGRTKNGRRWLPLEQGVDPERVERIVASVREKGFINHPAFYVLRDQYERVLSGRHRLAAAKVLSKEHPFVWPEKTVEVLDDADAVRIAYEANRSDRWNEGEEAALAEGEVTLASRAQTRALIRAELHKDPCRPNDTIAQIVGCSDMTVHSERLALERISQIRKFRATRGTKAGQMVEVDDEGRPIGAEETEKRVRKETKPSTEDESSIIARMREGERSGELWKDTCLATGFPDHGGNAKALRLRAEAKKQIAVEDAVQAATATPPTPTLPPDTNDQPAVPATVAQPSDPTPYREEETKQPESSPTATQPENYPDRAYVLSLVQQLPTEDRRWLCGQLPIEDRRWLCGQLEDLLNG